MFSFLHLALTAFLSQDRTDLDCSVSLFNSHTLYMLHRLTFCCMIHQSHIHRVCIQWGHYWVPSTLAAGEHMQNYVALKSKQLPDCGWYKTIVERGDSYYALVTVATCHICLARTVPIDMITYRPHHTGATWITVARCRPCFFWEQMSQTQMHKYTSCINVL